MKALRLLGLLIVIALIWSCTGGRPLIKHIPPRLDFVALDDDDVVNGRLKVECRGVDPTGIDRASMRLFVREPESKQEYPEHWFDDQHLQLGVGEAAISGTLDTSKATRDGPIEVVCVMADVTGMTSELAIIVNINSNAAEVEILEPAQGATVDGIVTIKCTCLDEPHDIGGTCEITSPSQDAENMTVVEQDSYYVTVHWDTTAEIDGEHTITCQGSSPELEPVRQSTTVTTNNRKAVTYCGRAFGTSPIADLTLWAIEIVDDRYEPYMIYETTETNDDGSWCITVDEEIADFALVSAGTSERFMSATTRDRSMKLGSNRMALYVEHKPESTETTVDGLSLHALTTTSYSTCRGLERMGFNRFDACFKAHELWSHYLDPEEMPDIRRIPFADIIESDPIGASEESIRLALVHVAMDYDGAYWALLDNLHASSRGWPNTMTTWCRDVAATGRFDGSDGTDPIYATPSHRHTARSPRIELASSGIRWTNNHHLPDGSGGDTNRTSLTVENHSRFWQHIATNDSELYARGHHPETLDLDPPAIAQEHNDDGAIVGTETVCFTIDDTFRDVQAEFVGEVVLDDVTFEAGQLCGSIDVDGYADGTITVEVRAADTLNETHQEYDYVVNNHKPEVVFVRPLSGPDGGAALLDGTVDIRVECSDGNGIVECYLEEPALTDTNPAADIFEGVWSTDGLTDGPYTLRATATDRQGSVGTSTTDVAVANLAPVTYKLRAYLAGQRLHGGQVSWHAVRGGVRGAAVATGAISGDGDHMVVVQGLAPGVVQFVGRWDDVGITHPVTGQNTLLDNLELTMMMLHQPAIEPTTQQHLSLTFASTVADALAFGRAANSDGLMLDEMGQAYEAITMHVSAGGGGIDLRRTYEVDLMRGNASTDDSSVVQLSLFGVMPCRWAADVSALYGSGSVGLLSCAQVLPQIIVDAADGCYDGVDADGRDIMLLPQHGVRLDPRLLTSTGAGAAMRWLDNVPVASGVPSTANATELRAEHLRTHLDYLASGASGISCEFSSPSLDWTSPTMEGSATDDGGSSITTVCADIADDSDIVDYGSEPPLADMRLDGTRLCGELDKTDREDGELPVTLWTRDYYGRRGETTIVIEINQQAPTITWTQSPPDAATGSVTLAVQCSDGNGIAECGVRLDGLSDTDPRPDVFSGRWDSSAVLDGPFEVVAYAVDAASVPRDATDTAPTTIDNLDPGILKLCTFADTAVVGAELVGCWLGSDGTCDAAHLDASITDQNGCVALSLPDTRAGLLRVMTRGGWYASATMSDNNGDPVHVYPPSDVGVTVTVDYAPARPGVVLADNNASYATTWADAWADARLDASTTADEHVQLLEGSYRRLGLHFGRDIDGIDILHTTPRDLIHTTSHATATSDASTRLGIVQVAIAQCAADFAREHGSQIDALPALVLAADKLRIDGSSRYYDGLNASGIRVTALGRPLDQNTLRHTLMTCGAIWLDSSNNRTSLSAGNFSQPAGFFSTASINEDVELFGPDAGDFVTFDRTPPMVSAVLVDQDLDPLPLDPIPVDRAISLRITASDDGGFVGADGRRVMPVVSIVPGPSAALGDPVLYDVSPTTLGVAYAVYLDDLGVGEHTIEISQADAVGNTTVAEIRILVDREAPTLTPNIPAYTQTASVPISWSSNEELSEVAIYDGGRLLTTVSDGSTSATVDLGECNREYFLSLTVKDRAKNTTTMPEPIAVTCDDRLPRFLRTDVPTQTNSVEIPVGWQTDELMGSISILVNGSVVQTVDGDDTEATVTLPSCDSTHSIQLQGTDLADNQGEGSVYTVICETDAPTFTAFGAPEWTGTTSILVDWEVSEPLRQLDIVLDDAVVASITDGRENHRIVLPECNDGYTVQLVATDLAGNVGPSEQRIVRCDNIRPRFTSHAVPSLISGTPDLAEMLVTWSANETISRLAIRIGDVEQVLELAQSVESAVVPLPRCNAGFPVTMRAYDFTGNESDPVGPDVVRCDMYDPFVALMVSNHDQENTMHIDCSIDSCDLVHDEESQTSIDLSQPGPHDIYHYQNRYCAGHRALPFIKFQASDLGDVKTDDTAVVVEYFYQSSSGDAFSEWRNLARDPDTSNTYRLELSPDSLLPSIYETDPERLHTVILRSRDEAGRYSEEVWVDFRLHYLFPPLVFSNAQLSGSLTRPSLEDGNIHEFFWAGESAEVLTMQVYWPWGNNNSPTQNAVLDLGGAVMSTRISHLSQAKHLTSDYTWQWDVAEWSCGDSGHNFGTLECGRGLAMEEEIQLDGPATDHAMIYTVEGATHRGGNRYEIEPNRAYTIRISARDPHVDIDGARFTWRRQDGQYEYDRVSGEEYDRRRFEYNSDLQTPMWELHRRNFAMQTYVSELGFDVEPIAVQADVGGQASGVVSATGHEAAMGPWNHLSSTR